ncbi:MAG: thioredoxin-dependent thiol peroxidase [Candidatus Sungbacteria bacterium]|nr:thioredoxin-dependent thiol peroxidase [bacterium]MDZ4260272.1 thioredoxin-dependent thiol peroxidase [Candidatus Sungbacteria bacterium]
MKLHIGTQAPDFTLPDQDGKLHTLSSLKGTRVLLYFYPKDDTPGCTKEACGFRDTFASFKKSNMQIFGISADSVSRHKKFAEKYNLPFPLLSDEKKEVLEKYGVWAEKKFLGKTYMGILRMSFLIAPDGAIEKIYEQVKPDIHATEVLGDTKN